MANCRRHRLRNWSKAVPLQLGLCSVLGLFYYICSLCVRVTRCFEIMGTDQGHWQQGVGDFVEHNFRVSFQDGENIGMLLDEKLRVSGFHEPSSAKDCGVIMAGDRLLAVNGKVLTGLDFSAAISVIKAAKYPKVFTLHPYDGEVRTGSGATVDEEEDHAGHHDGESPWAFGSGHVHLLSGAQHENELRTYRYAPAEFGRPAPCDPLRVVLAPGADGSRTACQALTPPIDWDGSPLSVEGASDGDKGARGWASWPDVKVCSMPGAVGR